MKKILLSMSLMLAACAPVSEETLNEKVRAAGFTDVRDDGWAIFGCGEHDTFRSKFTAKNAHGQWVSGTLCCGWLKNCTVRF
jgi:hypothetical protein